MLRAGRKAAGRRPFARSSRGMTLLEVAGMLLIAGIMLQAVLTGEAMIRTARVDGVIAQQRAAEAAVMAFQDRFQAWPGDYANAAATITCPGGPCLNGDGNGRIEAGNAAGLREDILAWTHLSAA